MTKTINRQWRLNGFSGFNSLELKEDHIPEIGDSDVLVRWKYASLNYRDLVVSKVCTLIVSGLHFQKASH